MHTAMTLQGENSIRRSVPGAHLLQLLYEACKENHDGFDNDNASISPQHLQHVKSLLDELTLQDLGLTEEDFSRDETENDLLKIHIPWRPLPQISYRHIHNSDRFSMGVFYLPASAVIPLHDHPKMTVLSKLVHGSMKVKSFDWLDPVTLRSHAGLPEARLAKLVTDDQVFEAPCESSVLFPASGGNIHMFTSVAGAAVLDVFLPPYSDEEDRPCKYYRESSCDLSPLPNIQSAQFEVDSQSFVWLEEIPPQEVVRLVPYAPPRLTD